MSFILHCTVLVNKAVLYSLLQDGSLIPETLVPTEFHIVKNPGVMGLEIHEG